MTPSGIPEGLGIDGAGAGAGAGIGGGAEAGGAPQEIEAINSMTTRKATVILFFILILPLIYFTIL
ncbi:MAG: hypothetical protein JSV54_06570 [Chloroflexota bacterium]|nr:MAG: hypothetical protein JSV54_06570 [Chloroflexota bacterium]